ncbi:hypothetical protein HOY80DRAFT_355472 [Tuber brumale]|nr:hypothetical protein HOY80DRAFT_355472 [Tuber brumale]
MISFVATALLCFEFYGTSLLCLALLVSPTFSLVFCSVLHYFCCFIVRIVLLSPRVRHGRGSFSNCFPLFFPFACSLELREMVAKGKPETASSPLLQSNACPFSVPGQRAQASHTLLEHSNSTQAASPFKGNKFRKKKEEAGIYIYIHIYIYIYLLFFYPDRRYLSLLPTPKRKGEKNKRKDFLSKLNVDSCVVIVPHLCLFFPSSIFLDDPPNILWTGVGNFSSKLPEYILPPVHIRYPLPCDFSS